MPRSWQNGSAGSLRSAKKGKNERKSAQTPLLTGINLIGLTPQAVHADKVGFRRVFASIRYKNGPAGV